MFDVKDYNYGYEGLVDSFGVEVVFSEHDEDYQGDSFYLLKDAEGRYGFLNFGWGSCSGCDAYEAIRGDGNDALEELRDELWESVSWFDSLEDLRVYLLDNNKLNWYGYRKTFKVFLEKLKVL